MPKNLSLNEEKANLESPDLASLNVKYFSLQSRKQKHTTSTRTATETISPVVGFYHQRPPDGSRMEDPLSGRDSTDRDKEKGE